MYFFSNKTLTSVTHNVSLNSYNQSTHNRPIPNILHALLRYSGHEFL